MLPSGEPKFRRRKADRPDEIVAAALEVFVEKGFAAARLDDIAQRAGVSKGALYLYFETKEDLFRAVVGQAAAPKLEMIRSLVAAHPGPFPDLARGMIETASTVIAQSPVAGLAKLVIGEARNFPEIARVWHDELVARMLETVSGAIAAAQARGEVRRGDPRHYAVALVSPLLMAVLWRETFTPIGAAPFDIPALARQHVDTLLRGLAPDDAE